MHDAIKYLQSGPKLVVAQQHVDVATFQHRAVLLLRQLHKRRDERVIVAHRQHPEDRRLVVRFRQFLIRRQIAQEKKRHGVVGAGTHQVVDDQRRPDQIHDVVREHGVFRQQHGDFFRGFGRGEQDDTDVGPGAHQGGVEKFTQKTFQFDAVVEVAAHDHVALVLV